VNSPEQGGGWIGVDVVWRVGSRRGHGVEPLQFLRFVSSFFSSRQVSIPMTVKRVQIGSRLVSWTSIVQLILLIIRFHQDTCLSSISNRRTQ